MNSEEAYEELIRLSREKTVLTSSLAMLQWDAEICMPRAGVQQRRGKMAQLAGVDNQPAPAPR